MATCELVLNVETCSSVEGLISVAEYLEVSIAVVTELKMDVSGCSLIGALVSTTGTCAVTGLVDVVTGL